MRAGRSRVMAGNTVRKMAPFIDTDIFAAESWLSDMAAKGLFFKDSSMWQNVIFEKGEPAERKYRLVPAGNYSRSASGRVGIRIYRYRYVSDA